MTTLSASRLTTLGGRPVVGAAFCGHSLKKLHHHVHGYRCRSLLLHGLLLHWMLLLLAAFGITLSISWSGQFGRICRSSMRLCPRSLCCDVRRGGALKKLLKRLRRQRHRRCW